MVPRRGSERTAGSREELQRYLSQPHTVQTKPSSYPRPTTPWIDRASPREREWRHRRYLFMKTLGFRGDGYWLQALRLSSNSHGPGHPQAGGELADPGHKQWCPHIRGLFLTTCLPSG